MVEMKKIEHIIKHLDSIKRREKYLYSEAHDILEKINSSNKYSRYAHAMFRTSYLDGIVDEVGLRHEKMAESIFNEISEKYGKKQNAENYRKNFDNDTSIYARLLKCPDLTAVNRFYKEVILQNPPSKDVEFFLLASIFVLANNWYGQGVKDVCERSYRIFIQKPGLEEIRNAIVHAVESGKMQKLEDGVYLIKYKAFNRNVSEKFDPQRIAQCIDILHNYGIVLVRSIAFVAMHNIIDMEIKARGGQTY